MPSTDARSMRTRTTAPHDTVHSGHRYAVAAPARASQGWQQCAARQPSDLAITVISVEEQLTGWYTLLRNARRPDDLAHAYQRLAETVRSLAPLTILPFTTSAIARYELLMKLRLNIGRMDVRIAAITLEHGGTLVTRNTRDFGASRAGA